VTAARRLALLLAAGLAGAPAAGAQPARPRPPVTAGLGVVAAPSPYAGVDAPDLTPVPFLNLELGRFYLRGVEAGYRLTQAGPLSLAAVVQPRLRNLHAGDSPALAGMETRRRTAEGGLRARLRAGRWHAGLRAVTDLLGRHDGQVVTAEAGVRLGGRRLSLSPTAGVEWQSTAFVDYYYGVRPAEARPGRPAYAPGSAANPFVGAAARMRLGGSWGLFGYLRHTWLDRAVTDSPIVDRSVVYSGVLAVTYAWSTDRGRPVPPESPTGPPRN